MSVITDSKIILAIAIGSFFDKCFVFVCCFFMLKMSNISIQGMVLLDLIVILYVCIVTEIYKSNTQRRALQFGYSTGTFRAIITIILSLNFMLFLKLTLDVRSQITNFSFHILFSFTLFIIMPLIMIFRNANLYKFACPRFFTKDNCYQCNV